MAFSVVGSGDAESTNSVSSMRVYCYTLTNMGLPITMSCLVSFPQECGSLPSPKPGTREAVSPMHDRHCFSRYFTREHTDTCRFPFFQLILLM